jgi:hypothetical protein
MSMEQYWAAMVPLTQKTVEERAASNPELWQQPLLADLRTAVQQLPATPGAGRQLHSFEVCVFRSNSNFDNEYSTMSAAYGNTDYPVSNAVLMEVLRMHREISNNCRPAIAMTSSVLDAVLSARRVQCFERYQARGGVQRAHLNMLANAWWESRMDRNDWFAICIDGKRPFGNSGWSHEAAEYAGLELPMIPSVDYPGKMEVDEAAAAPVIEQAMELFDELGFAIIDVCRKALDSFDPNS